jgi:hypothetical protein
VLAVYSYPSGKPSASESRSNPSIILLLVLLSSVVNSSGSRGLVLYILTSDPSGNQSPSESGTKALVGQIKATPYKELGGTPLIVANVLS